MPATPIYALPYPATADPADVPLDMQELAEQLAKVLGGALAATPPASPIEGQLWYFPAAAGVVWTFRYNAGSASAFKWEFVGGSPLYAEITPQESTGSATYVDLATPGPLLTVPRAGDYLLGFGVGDCRNEVTQNRGANATLKLGTAAAGETNRIIVLSAATLPMIASLAREIVRTLAASDDVRMQYRADAGGQVSFGNRWLRITPRRVS